MIPTAMIRISKVELNNMNIVILKGVHEKIPLLSAIGWVEDKPHEDAEAIVLNEPLYFVNTTPEGAREPQISFLPLEYSLPMQEEFFEYTRVTTFEGITSTAEMYINTIMQAREYRPRYTVKWESLSSIFKQK